ncbi:MAG: HlyD family efflux transporter periplasmic adaptor subunit [Deltaproteobacteria bacterium]|nr:HlyD family efflux transporter periplasmic adaptor subunit [Deltaproteobacteria bacterium]
MKHSGKKYVGWIVAATAVGLLVYVILRPQPVMVEVAPVIRGPFVQTIDEDGKTRVRERYTVSAPLEGTIERIRLKAGAPVEQGMLLAIIHPRVPGLLDVRVEQELRARLSAAEATHAGSRAAVERAQAALTQAKADYERTKKLAEQELVPPARREHDELAVTLAMKDLQAAQFANRAATHQVEMARAALLRVQKPLPTNHGDDQHWEIHAPVLGRVLRVFQESEGVVTLGTPLLEIADPADLEVVVDVLTTDAVHIAPGSTVWFERWGGTPAVKGRVRLVEPSAFTKISALGIEEQRVNVVIDVTDDEEQWRGVGDGYRVDARIVTFQAEDAVQVPVGALFRDGDGWAVFVMADGYARKRGLQVDRRGSATALVTQGLAVDEQVIVYPSDAVQDGVRVLARVVG